MKSSIDIRKEDIKLKIIKNKENKNEKTKLYHFFSGSISASITAIFLQPLDVIRTQQQGIFSKSSIVPNHINVKNTKKTIINVTSYLYNNYGMYGLWRGTWPTFLRVSFGAGFYFVTLNHMTKELNKINQYKYKKDIQNFISGATARILATTLLCPLTVIKARAEWQNSTQSINIIPNIYNIYIKEGMKGLYRGLGVSLVRDVPFSAFYVLFYKKIQKQFQKEILNNDNQSFSHRFPFFKSQIFTSLISGILAGVISTGLTHPADVIKTRMQLDIFETKIVKSDHNNVSVNNRNTVQTLKKIVKGEGLKGFYKGFGPRMLKRTLATSITWTFYEIFLSKV